MHRTRTSYGWKAVVAVVSSLGLLLGGVTPAGASTPERASAEQRCAAMVGQQVRIPGDVAIVESASVTAVTPSTPEHCDLKGVIGRIHFQVRLPTTAWNGSYFQTGCGGFCGAIPIGSCGQALDRGYAVAAEDTGHVGGADGSWALDDRKAEVDFGHRSPHVTAVTAKALLERFYGKPAEFSYFQGCSTGGRQALSEAQRYPGDFDGIVAGAPALYQNQLATLSQGFLETVNRAEDGTLILSRADSTIVRDAVLEACDAPDGRVDGVVGNPDACDFDPGVLLCQPDSPDGTCLTAAQVDVVRAFYSAPLDDKGDELYPSGLSVGSEGGWPGFSIGTDTTLSGGGNYAQSVLRYLAFPKDPGADYSLFDFDPDKDAPRLRAMAQVYNADDTDLRAFERNGGKLLVWHGWADPLIAAGGTVDYVRDAVAANGGRAQTEDWMRLFLLPGVYHCAGGPGEDSVDWLTTIEDWVERGVAPDSVVATKRAQDGGVVSTRVVQEYLP